MITGIPWWGGLIISTGLVFVGVVPTLLAAFFSDRRKFKREDRLKHRDRLTELVLTLIDSQVLLERLVIRVKGEPLVSQEAKRQAMNDIHTHINRFMLFDRGGELCAAAKESGTLALKLQSIIDGSKPSNAAQEKEAHLAYREALREFIAKAQEELQIPK